MLPETIMARVKRYLEQERAASNLVEPTQVLALALDAVRKYQGSGLLEEHIQQRAAHQAAIVANPSTPPLVLTEVNAEFPIHVGEWGVIERLFKLYVEAEQSKQLEATRMMGAEVFGRSTSEVEAEIQQAHDRLPVQAFYFPPSII